MSAEVPRDVKHWVRSFAAPKFRLGQQVAGALAQRGLLRTERARRFGLVPVQRLRLLDRRAREELLATAGLALADAAPPSPRVPLFDAGDRQLAREMTQYWRAFTEHGRPKVPGQTPWPPFGKDGATLFLRAGGQSTIIDDATFDAEHQCSFWATLPAVDVTA